MSVRIAPTVDRQPPANVRKVIAAVEKFLGPDADLGLFVADHNHGDVEHPGSWSIALEGAYGWPHEFVEAQRTERTIPAELAVSPVAGWCLGVHPEPA